MNRSMGEGIIIRSPIPTDGMGVYALIAHCPPLDTNSSYCNLLQCTHFSETSVIVELDGDVVGFISGYLLPDDPSTLFVWQVAVAATARGKGLAISMIENILARDKCAQVKHLETTITEDNAASWALFTAVANKRSAALITDVFFDSEKHFGGLHDSEIRVTIGPFA